jgi:hypothetical protein
MTGTLPLDLRFATVAGAAPGADLTGSADLDPEDRAAIAAATGGRALWRTWLPGPPARRSYVLWGEPVPGMDSFTDPARLTPYLRAALACGALLWTTEPAPEIRFAGLYDAYDPATGPGFDDSHPVLAGPERDRTLAYLNAAPRLVATTVTSPDVLDGTPGVPMDLRTDGVWVWSEGTRHYLDRHGLAPDPGLAGHLAANGYTVPAVSPVALHRAMAAVQTPM